MPIEISVDNTKKIRIFPNAKYQRLNLGNRAKKSVKFSEELFLFEKKED